MQKERLGCWEGGRGGSRLPDKDGREGEKVDFRGKRGMQNLTKAGRVGGKAGRRKADNHI